ncbi:MAG: YkgJ family cysteine cluster protein [Thermodesulfobacteriota bacterium]
MPEVPAYHALVVRVDAEARQLQAYYGSRLRCRVHCSACCQDISLCPLEWHLVQAAVTRLPAALLARLQGRPPRPAGRCPLLLDERCPVYPARPILCRSQGLPLAYLDELAETIEVSACPVSFPETDVFAPEGLLFLDEINRELASLNEAWCRRHGKDPQERIPLSTVLRQALTIA